MRARFFVVAVNGAGARAQARRDRVLQGLADMIDAGRARARGTEVGLSQHRRDGRPGRSTARSSTKVRDGAIERDEEFLSELVYMAMMPYLGARAAEDELLVQPLH